MVQFQSNLTLTLEALGSCGVVLPLEQKVRLTSDTQYGILTNKGFTEPALYMQSVTDRPAVWQAVLAHSLPLKQAKAGLRSVRLWGKVTARNGKVSQALVSASLACLTQHCDHHKQALCNSSLITSLLYLPASSACLS